MATYGLLEREEELVTIERALDAVGDGDGGTLVIEGEAGAGKTALLGAAEVIARERGMRVLRARGSEFERDFPYGVIRQLFDQVLSSGRGPGSARLEGSAALAAPVFDSSGAVDPQSVQHGLYWLASDLAEDGPLLLVVDDAQWADRASLQTLAYVGRRLEGSQLGLALTVRTGEPDAHHELLDELRREAGSCSISPSPLSAAAVAELVGAADGRSSAAFAEACRTASGGNPFLVVELIRALDAEGSGGGEEDPEQLARLTAAGASRAILGRLARLGADEAEVARAVAILEPNAEIRLVAALAGLEVESALTAAGRLAGSSLLADGRPAAFAHPLVREAVLSEMGESGRAAAHSAAAGLLAEDGADLDAVAAHLLLAEPIGDGTVVEQLRSAAGAALNRGAPAAAAGYLRRALGEPPPRGERVAVRRELGVALLRGDNAEGIDVLREVRGEIDDVDERAEVGAVLSNSLMFRARHEEAESILFDSLDEVSDPLSARGLNLQLHLLLAMLAGLEGLPSRYMPDPEQDLGPESAVTRAILCQAALFCALGLGPMESVPRYAERIEVDSDKQREDSRLGLPHSPIHTAMAIADQGDRAIARYEAALEGARERGTLSGVSGVHGARSYSRLIDGDLAEAQADAEIALRVASEKEFSSPTASWVGALVRTLTARGESEAAARVLDDFADVCDDFHGMPGGLVKIARGELLQATGRHREACASFRAAGERLAWIPHPNPEAIGWQPGLALSLAALGEAEEASEFAAKTLAAAEKSGGSRGIGVALRAQGVVATGADGIEPLRAAAETLAGTRARLQHAEALVELGAALRRSNHRRDAREPLREGLELAHRCGAASLEERARSELSAAGARPRSVVRTGVDSLTPSELRVARLAAEGLTNREVAQSLTVTPKTVETHLRHAYQKLEVSGRTELAGALGADATPIHG